ncbi:DUF3347 domain-containing protein [Aureibacter tunicatorum]|uniref:DUF3347 domain-containing protein n=1 Tax=Aureibacter tunicatorum TaxID=866807 RepID=A0AAE3XPC2_9BACT|nr:DUF3347 domain-containing protein [Aureibacter tunicatorum]MDR6241596.1 hypothetical protein [Aureibacter tunicatorum]BDD07180.1 hypothetical protein AUTU_46630 [Aureibacter tunicatorum]
MKITKIHSIVLLVAIVLSSTYSLNSFAKLPVNKEASARTQQDNTSSLINHYLKIKDALVNSNAKEASDEAQKLKAYISKNKAEYSKMSKPVKAIASSNSLNVQRNAFSDLSALVYQSQKEDSKNVTLYRQYCPMAFDYAGGYWLSAEKEVNNPYFGDKMLHCGKVVEEM